MTEEVKFPGTDVDAPVEIYAAQTRNTGKRMWFADTDGYTWAVIPHSLKYHREDTVTPNYKVTELMEKAFDAGISAVTMNGKKNYIDFKEKMINEIRSSYASSDSD